MIKNNEEFLKLINETILKEYEINLKGFGKEESSVLAYYNTQDKQIYVNKHNKYVFNDYFMFITTMQHENVHLVNNLLGVKDVDIDENGKQWHNEYFKNRMLEDYCLKVCNEYGNIDFADKENKDIFAYLINQSIKYKDTFHELQEYYLDNIYEELPQESQQNQDGDNPNPNPENDEEKEETDDRSEKEKSENEEKDNGESGEKSEDSGYKETDEEYTYEEEGGVEI